MRKGRKSFQQAIPVSSKDIYLFLYCLSLTCMVMARNVQKYMKKDVDDDLLRLLEGRNSVFDEES